MQICDCARGCAGNEVEIKVKGRQKIKKGEERRQALRKCIENEYGRVGPLGVAAKLSKTESALRYRVEMRGARPGRRRRVVASRRHVATWPPSPFISSRHRFPSNPLAYACLSNAIPLPKYPQLTFFNSSNKFSFNLDVFSSFLFFFCVRKLHLSV